MELNPQKALEELENHYKTYLHTPADRRGELAVTLQRAIARGEIEAGNLSHHAASDVEQRLLYKRLLTTIELAKGSMPQR